jgi:hypothetical protein
MPRSLWPPWIVGWLLLPYDDGGKDEDTEVKYSGMRYVIKPKRGRRFLKYTPGNLSQTKGSGLLIQKK